MLRIRLLMTRLLFFFSLCFKMEAQIKNLKLELLNERKMRHESRKEVSKQPTNGFITVIRDAPWPSEDIKRCLTVFTNIFIDFEG